MFTCIAHNITLQNALCAQYIMQESPYDDNETEMNCKNFLIVVQESQEDQWHQ